MRLDVPAQIKTDHTTPRAVAYLAIAFWICALVFALPRLAPHERQSPSRTIRPLRFTQPPEGLTPSRRIEPRLPSEDMVAHSVIASSHISPTLNRERE